MHVPRAGGIGSVWWEARTKSTASRNPGYQRVSLPPPLLGESRECSARQGGLEEKRKVTFPVLSEKTISAFKCSVKQLFLKLPLPSPVNLGVRVHSQMCLLCAWLCARSSVNVIPLHWESRLLLCTEEKVPRLRACLICQRSHKPSRQVSSKDSPHHPPNNDLNGAKADSV